MGAHTRNCLGTPLSLISRAVDLELASVNGVRFRVRDVLLESPMELGSMVSVWKCFFRCRTICIFYFRLKGYLAKTLV